jgi:hypothetical protein
MAARYHTGPAGPRSPKRPVQTVFPHNKLDNELADIAFRLDAIRTVLISVSGLLREQNADADADAAAAIQRFGSDVLADLSKRLRSLQRWVQ